MRGLQIFIGLIFGLIFAGGGIFIFSQTSLPTWQNWRAMQHWQPGFAELLSVSGSNNQTSARYRYQVKGISYQGDRVYVAGFSDNIGSYQQDLLQQLRQLRRQGSPVAIWIDPADPRQSVIDRDMRWGLFAFTSGFCAVFVLIGLFIAYFMTRSGTRPALKRPSLLALRKEWKQLQTTGGYEGGFIEFCEHKAKQFRQAGDGETDDWRSRKGWETEKIRSEGLVGIFAIWGFALLWNAIVIPSMFALPKEFEAENYLALIALLFPLVGIYLIVMAIFSTLKFRRFGSVVFEMDPFPGAIGGHVGGRIHVPRLDYRVANHASAQIAVRLECVNSYVSGSGKSRSRYESIDWAEEGRPQIENSAQGVSLIFRFDVPDQLPEAEAEQSGDYFFWRLIVKADIPGIDLNRVYNIPVIKTGASSRFVRHDISAQVAANRRKESEAAKLSISQGDFDLPGLTRAMRFSRSGNQMKLEFPMFRNKILTMYAAIFGGGFSFASYSMINQASAGGGFGIFIGLFSIPFILVAIVASLATLYLLFNNLRVIIDTSGIRVLRRLLFIPVYARRLNASDISRLSIKRSGSTGQGVNRINHYKLLAHRRGDDSVTIAEDIDGEALAGHFRDYLGQRLNIATGA